MVDVTILVCIYGKDDPNLLRKSLGHLSTVKSVIILVVIDGPVSSSLKSIAYEFADDVLELPTNVGHGLARRAGMSKVKTAYAAISDADDMSAPHRFKRSRDYLRVHPRCGVVSSSVLEMWENNQTSIKRINQDSDYWKFRSPVNQQTALIRMQSYTEAGGYLDWYHNEDTYLWYRIMKSGWTIGYIDEIFAKVTMNSQSIARRRGLKYFSSEVSLRALMYVNGDISFFHLIWNIIVRLITQLLMPNFFLIKVYLWIRNRTK